jgi:DNA polymerase-3 subunit beta
MKLIVSQRSLLAALKTATVMADTSAKNTSPILGSIVLRGNGDTLEVLSTDMSLSLRETVAAEVRESGEVACSVKKFREIVAALSSGDVVITGRDNHWVEIVEGKSRFNLMGLNPTDFPPLPTPNENAAVYEIEKALILDLMEKVHFSVSPDSARVNLNGVLLEANGESVTMVSTDGHRLTFYRKPVDEITFDPSVLLPLSGIDALATVLARMPEKVTMYVDPGRLGNQRQAFVSSPGMTFCTRVTHAVFPPYKQVIPSSNAVEVTATWSDLDSALRRALVMAPERTAQVRITFKHDVLEIDADNPEVGATHQECPIVMVKAPLDVMTTGMTASFNARYVHEAISKMSGDITIKANGELDPIVIGSNEYLCVVMPMRM